jgi:hypothetical protein
MLATANQSSQSELIEAAPGFVRSPFVILIDKAEKAAWTFDDIRSRSFVDKEMRLYQPRLERRFLGIGCGDYSLDGYAGRVGIERKSMVDFQGTLLGWRREVEANGGWTIDVDRRACFKRELKTLAGFECKAVVVEASLGECLEQSPEWGKRTAAENSKYLFSTYLAWVEEFPGVPWIFAADRRMAEVTAFRILEKYWARMAKQRRKKKIEGPKLFV